MDKIKEKAKQLLLGNQEYLFNYSNGDVDVDYPQMIGYITSKMIEFARQCCELQKQKCANVGYNFGNSARNVVQEEILNCKNICDEP